jgi:hypothetical protein
VICKQFAGAGPSAWLKIGRNYVETTITIRIQIARRMAATKIGSGGVFDMISVSFGTSFLEDSFLEDRIACTAL